jgi:uncharacterized protein YbcC (UPF0753/DUF2309 family)
MPNSPPIPFDSPPLAKGAARRDNRPARAGELQEAIEHATHYLPAQGPIKVFIHHNTLHAFEHLPFDEGVQAGGKMFGCQPYLPEDRYRELLASGRIRPDDLFVVLLDDLGDDADTLIGFLGTRFHFRLALLQYPPRVAPTAELRWFLVETDALVRMHEEVPPEVRARFLGETRHWVLRDLGGGQAAPAGGLADPKQRQPPAFLRGLFEQFGKSSPDEWSEPRWEAFALQALWRVCREGVHGLKMNAPQQALGVRHRDSLWAATGADSDLLVHEVLIRYCAAFLDQGFSPWPLPNRDEGFFRAFLALYGRESGPPDLWLEDLPTELARLAQSQVSPLDSILESLDLLGVDEAEWRPFLTNTLLALRGWAGMIEQVELRADSVAQAIPRGSLPEFLAVRLILERLALAWLAKDALGYDGPLASLRQAAGAAAHKHEAIGVDQRAYQVFHLAQVLGWLPQQLAAFSKSEWAALIAEIEAFPALQRRRIYHAAYERRYRVPALDAIALHSQRSRDRVPTPRFQVICCLDEREESFRRHLEEVAQGVETIGAAGFFSVPMYYRGAADAHHVPLCPIVIRPQHWVQETVAQQASDAHSSRAKARRALGMASHQVHVGSRTFTGGALLAAGFGALASIPLVARVLFPRLTARIRQRFSQFVQPPRQTQLELERATTEASSDPGRGGFSLDEMVNMSERLLRDIGLIESFARLVVVLGHGSNSLNNPHNSAYNCGACGGGCGGPNARALAQMLNDPRVRAQLQQRGISVPAESAFVGGWHNTCDDRINYFDLDRLSQSRQGDLERVQRELEETCDRNAHERCRRFMSAPLNMSFPAARRHVEARSEDLAQTRPECGHATNALCIVARRSRTQGLFLDRRAFLTSYDPTQDDADGTILTRLLQAAVPVCGGINLEYYFSYVDNVGYGCGTKLPHNVTSLLGVMDGAASDLRTGLPWQMVEIHEPVRLLLVIETTPHVMLQVMDRNPAIGQLCRNGWVQVATLSPDSSAIHLLRNGKFEPYRPESNELPHAPTSTDWYRGWRDHLGFAAIGS